MADFYPAAAQIQNPDILGSYIRGQMAPLQMQAAQQENQYRGLQMEQLKMVLQNQKLYQQYAQGLLNQEGAQNLGGRSGGIQNGPQDAVSHQSPGNPTQPSGSYDGSVGGFQPNTLAALAILRGDDPLKTMQGTQEYALKQRQIQAQGPMALAETVSSSPNADVIVKNNPSLQQQWIQIAPQLGLDPFKDLTPENARKAAIFGYNQLAGSAGLPPKPMPTEYSNVNLGQGEVAQINKITGKKDGDLIERQTPGYTLVDVYDPKSNSTRKVPVQTSGFGMGGVNPNAPKSGNGAPGFDAGPKAPTDAELKAAMFGSEMRSGMNTLTKLETKGISLSPKVRAAFINAATSEDSGLIKQFFGQEALLHGLTKNEQTYMAALMPLLQAAGHDQSGARLTTGQVRQNLEALIPIDTKNKDAMEQVKANREGFYNGLLTQAGSAAQLPQYASSLGADLKAAQDKATSGRKTPEAGTVIKGYRFKGGDPSNRNNWEKVSG